MNRKYINRSASNIYRSRRSFRNFFIIAVFRNNMPTELQYFVNFSHTICLQSYNILSTFHIILLQYNNNKHCTTLFDAGRNNSTNDNRCDKIVNENVTIISV